MLWLNSGFLPKIMTVWYINKPIQLSELTDANVPRPVSSVSSERSNQIQLGEDHKNALLSKNCLDYWVKNLIVDAYFKQRSRSALYPAINCQQSCLYPGWNIQCGCLHPDVYSMAEQRPGVCLCTPVSTVTWQLFIPAPLSSCIPAPQKKWTLCYMQGCVSFHET